MYEKIIPLLFILFIKSGSLCFSQGLPRQTNYPINEEQTNIFYYSGADAAVFWQPELDGVSLLAASGKDIKARRDLQPRADIFCIEMGFAKATKFATDEIPDSEKDVIYLTRDINDSKKIEKHRVERSTYAYQTVTRPIVAYREKRVVRGYSHKFVPNGGYILKYGGNIWQGKFYWVEDGDWVRVENWANIKIPVYGEEKKGAIINPRKFRFIECQGILDIAKIRSFPSAQNIEDSKTRSAAPVHTTD